MILIYAYINKFKNYTTQEIIFDPRWQINFSNKKLSIQYRGQSSASCGHPWRQETWTTCIFLLEKQGLERRICFR